MKILIVEDDAALADVIRRGLGEGGHIVDVAHDGVTGVELASGGDFDAIVLDVLLPRKDGLSVARDLRATGLRTPVLMLTARDTVDDVIVGLDAGADDYLRKPFAFEELEARLRAISRREPTPVRQVLRIADVRMDLATRRVFRADQELQLSARETAFLEYFMRNAGLLITRSMIQDALWEHDRETTSNVIEVYVRRLRQKLALTGGAELLQTVRGAGYRFG